uniref:Uncharacterized protein n=1 Tax=Kalanchoe fedtschenkoi TaxID=63787 RepID=A0A7N0TH74_KALFE
MGNCVAGQHTIRVMDADGKVLEYQTPIKVHQVLSKFSGYGISDTLPAIRYLPPDSYMNGHYMYYLVPQPMKPLQEIVNGENRRAEKKKKKVVRFAEEDGEGESSGAVRIKLVITRSQLDEMINNGLVVNGLSDSAADVQETFDCSSDLDFRCVESGQWTPALQTIHEVDNHEIV